MKVSIHQPQYWPGLRFFAKRHVSDAFIYLDDVQFEKRGFQNRNRIRTARGWQYLSVPVVTKGRFSQKINEVEIDNSRPWREEHLLAIKFNYARARFFKDYLPLLESLYAMRYRTLRELAIATVSFFVRNSLMAKRPVMFSSDLKTDETSSARLVQLCAAIGAKEYLSGTGARAYLEEKHFIRAGIKVSWQEFTPREYPQAFPGFEPDMSALDLVLNCGPRAVEWL